MLLILADEKEIRKSHGTQILVKHKQKIAKPDSVF
jgi:hypothetical protein